MHVGMFETMQGKELWYSYSLKYITARLRFVQINVDKLP